MKTIKTTNRYPGWNFEVETKNGRTEYFATKADYGYAVDVFESKGEFFAELLTRRTWDGRTTWESARVPFTGTVAAVIAEAERRTAYHKAQGRPWAA